MLVAESVRLVEAIWPGPRNCRCVVGESVTKNPRYLVAARLFKGEILPKGLGRRDKSRLLTLRKQRLRNLFAALCMTREPEGNQEAFTSQEAIVLLV